MDEQRHVKNAARISSGVAVRGHHSRMLSVTLDREDAILLSGVLQYLDPRYRDGRMSTAIRLFHEAVDQALIQEAKNGNSQS